MDNVSSVSSTASTAVVKFVATYFVINEAVGVGMLNIPEAFKFAGGVTYGVILQLLVIMLALLGLIALGILAIELDCASVQEIMLFTSGKFWYYVSSVVVILCSFFTCVAYHVAMGDLCDRVFFLFGPSFCQTWYLNRKFTMVVASTLIFLPLLFNEKLDFMRYVSYVAITAVLFLVFLMIFTGIVGNDPKGVILWKPKDLLRIIFAIPPFGFACHVHLYSIPIFWSMEDQSRKGVIIVSCFAMFGVFVLYSTIGACGYLTFGSLIKSDVLLNYPPDGVLTIIAFVLVTIKIWSMYPGSFYFGRDALLDICAQSVRADNESGNSSKIVPSLLIRIIISLCWFVCAVLVAVFTTRIAIIIDVLGFFVAFLMFFFPGLALVYYAYTDEEGESLSDVPSVSFIILGVFLMVLGVIFSIISLCVLVWRLIIRNEFFQVLCE